MGAVCPEGHEYTMFTCGNGRWVGTCEKCGGSYKKNNGGKIHFIPFTEE